MAIGKSTDVVVHCETGNKHQVLNGVDASYRFDVGEQILCGPIKAVWVLSYTSFPVQLDTADRTDHENAV